jgi:enoyl-CoA hydratase/carnithine racemase
MNINDVLTKAKDQGKDKYMTIVQDGTIFYLVLLRQDNTFDFEFIKQMNDCLDLVEKSEGPAVMVCIGVGEKIFSTGFNLPTWEKEGFITQWQSIMSIHKLFDRILTLPVPTLAVKYGMSISGGLLISLVFDFRTMKDDPKNFVCISEINIGLSLTPGFSSIVKYSLDPQTSKILVYGGRFNS